MDAFLTVTEIKAKFDSEWVLVAEPQTDEYLEIQSGKVLYHSKDRDEVYREAIKLRPKRFALLYTGTITKGMAVAL